MKCLLIITIAFLILAAQSSAQDTIRRIPLSITTGYTTNLIFPLGIAQVDIGSRDILIRKFGPGNNVLLLKADRRNFPTTNLSVYTKDGHLYSYMVSYADSISTYNYSYAPENEYIPPARESQPFIHVHGSSGGVRCKLTGLYIRNELLYLVVTATNKSPVAFEPEGMVFRIEDRKWVKRSVVQQQPVIPVYSKEPSRLDAGKHARLSYSLPPPTFGKQKKLVLEWKEKDGGRRIKLVIPSKLILRARPLP